MSDRLKMIVCAKQVPDPEGPPSAFEVDPKEMKVTVRGIPPVINPFCENALEAAIRIKESYGGKVTVVSMGKKLSKPILSKALGAGADELILIQDEEFEGLNSLSTAWVLSAAIEKLGGYDIVLTGRQAGDWDSGQVGLILAEFLGLPSINWARSVEIEDGKVLVERVRPGGYEVVEVKMPVLITASNEVGELRYVSVKALKEAREKPVRTLTLDGLGIDPSELKRRTIVELSSPSMERKCKFIDGKQLEEVGENLAIQLKEDGII